MTPTIPCQQECSLSSKNCSSVWIAFIRYLTYGEDEWKELTEGCLASMELYNDETRNSFEHTLGWLDRVSSASLVYPMHFSLANS